MTFSRHSNGSEEWKTFAGEHLLECACSEAGPETTVLEVNEHSDIKYYSHLLVGTDRDHVEIWMLCCSPQRPLE